MYRYTIGEDSYEDYHEYEILHKNLFTKEEFIYLCKEAFKELDFEIKKEIAESCASQGTYYVVNLLTEKYGFILPNKVICHIHLGDLSEHWGMCEECPHSYYLNGKLKCNSEDCNIRPYEDE